MQFGHISGIFVFPLEGITTSYFIAHGNWREFKLESRQHELPRPCFSFIFAHKYDFSCFFAFWFPRSMDYLQTKLSSFSVHHVTFCSFVFVQAGVVYSNNIIIMSSMQTQGQIIHATSHGLEPTLTIHKYVFFNILQLRPV